MTAGATTGCATTSEPLRRPGWRGVLLLLGALLCTAPAGVAQDLPAPSSAASFSLLTVTPGPAVHARFGHSALRLVDPVYRIDAAFNYGTFSFGPDFLPRFIHGELDYILSVQRTGDLVAQARYDGRGVSEQLLDLTQEQVRALYVALEANARPENRTYRYDFLYDNCSTRIVDMLQRVLGDGLLLPDPDAPAPTFREQIDAYLGDAPWLDLGIDLSLGTEVDAPTTAARTWFLPAAFETALDTAWLDGRPLVTEKRELLAAPPPAAPTLAARLLHPAVPAGLLLALAAFGLVRRLVTGRARGPWADRLAFGVFGLLGVILTYFWFGTLHHVAHANWNLAWAWPTHLLVAFVVARRPLPRWLAIYLLAAGGVAAVAALDLAVPQPLHPVVRILCGVIVLRVLTLLAPVREAAAP